MHLVDIAAEALVVFRRRHLSCSRPYIRLLSLGEEPLGLGVTADDHGELGANMLFMRILRDGTYLLRESGGFHRSPAQQHVVDGFEHEPIPLALRRAQPGSSKQSVSCFCPGS
jgi:hypothetical protein